MINVRRWYIYLVCIIALQAVVWAFIGLVRDLLVPAAYGPSFDLAIEIAILIIGLPILLGHWLWAQRLARRDPEERASMLRRFYLYAVLGACLAPFVANAFDLVEILLGRVFGETSKLIMPWEQTTAGELAIASLVPLVILPLVGLYHGLVLREDVKAAPEVGELGTIRRLFVLVFSAIGLTMTSLAVVEIGGWIIRQMSTTITPLSDYALSSELARLIVGLPLWVLFWTGAQRLARSSNEDEQRSAARRTYLYSAVFVGVLAFVTTLALVLGDFLKQLLDAAGAGESGDIAVPTIITAAAVWAYHGTVLRRDGQTSTESAWQASIRRGYFYLVAAIGLVAWLIGLAGAIGVTTRVVLSIGMVTGLKEDVANFIAMIIAGLPVWLLAWRRIQLTASDPGDLGEAEIRSTVRKVYLYLCLFGGTMTVLGSAVFVVAKIVGSLIGVEAEVSTTELADAIAFSLIAAGVWVYHGTILRSDGKRVGHEEARRLSKVHVAVLDAGDGSLGRALLDGLSHALPGLDVKTFGLTPTAMAGLGSNGGQPELGVSLAESQVIIAPWTAVVSGASGGAVGPVVAEAVVASPAHKVLLPVHEEHWTLTGATRERQDEMVKQAVHAVEQIAHGKEVTPKRSLSLGSMILLVAGGLWLISTVGGLVFFLLGNLLF